MLRDLVSYEKLYKSVLTVHHDVEEIAREYENQFENPDLKKPFTFIGTFKQYNGNGNGAFGLHILIGYD